MRGDALLSIDLPCLLHAWLWGLGEVRRKCIRTRRVTGLIRRCKMCPSIFLTPVSVALLSKFFWLKQRAVRKRQSTFGGWRKEQPHMGPREGNLRLPASLGVHHRMHGKGMTHVL